MAIEPPASTKEAIIIRRATGKHAQIPCGSAPLQAGWLVAVATAGADKGKLIAAGSQVVAQVVLGVSTHSAAAGEDVLVESGVFSLYFDAVADASLIGSPAYAINNNCVTATKTDQTPCTGLIKGFEQNGDKVVAVVDTQVAPLIK